MKNTNTVWVDNDKLNNLTLDKIKIEIISQNDKESVVKSQRMHRSLNQKGIQKELNRS